jgi:ribonuclease HII
MRWVIGIDEAGRGPLAGPISVGAVAIPIEQNKWSLWKELKDSKKLSEKQREIWFEKIKTSDVLNSVAMVRASTIDRVGIVRSAVMATKRCIQSLSMDPNDTKVFLDWGLSAPDEWTQEQFVKGDERFPAIALASIVAKVSRDRHLCALARQFPEYDFDKHKGYGTKAHYDAIRQHGACSVHRHTFLGNACPNTN